MKVNIDATRIIHLLTLLVLTVSGGQILIRTWEWNPLTAYGFVCTIVCQISNVIMKILDGDDLSKLLNDNNELSPSDNKKKNKEKDGQNRSNNKKKRR